jgi:GAF domain-containing protein
MPHRDTLLRIYECGEPDEALRELARALAGPEARRRAWWLGAKGELKGAAPAAYPPPPEVLQGVARGAASVVLADGREVRILGLREGGALALAAVAWEGDGWREVADAFGRVSARADELSRAEEERDELRQRAEESEALHVLGLAANRTLDPDEVLALVARFARALLGAHYVTVNTAALDGTLRTTASVGLRAHDGESDDPFALRVAEAGKPVVLEGEEADAEPFHAAEGMQAGVGVPLSLFGETFGALVIGYRRAYQPAPRDVRLALTLAGHAAVAIGNARLHRALAERGGELERANEELRWSTEAKERFFASMSHELRTPLNAILGYQDLLLDGVVGPIPEGSALVPGAGAAGHALAPPAGERRAGPLQARGRKMDLVCHPAACARWWTRRSPPWSRSPSCRGSRWRWSRRTPSRSSPPTPTACGRSSSTSSPTPSSSRTAGGSPSPSSRWRTGGGGARGRHGARDRAGAPGAHLPRVRAGPGLRRARRHGAGAPHLPQAGAAAGGRAAGEEHARRGLRLHPAPAAHGPGG